MFEKFKKSKEVNEDAVEETKEVKSKKSFIPKILIGGGLVAAGLFTGKLLKKHNDKINEDYYSNCSGDEVENETSSDTDD